MTIASTFPSNIDGLQYPLGDVVTGFNNARNKTEFK